MKHRLADDRLAKPGPARPARTGHRRHALLLAACGLLASALPARADPQAALAALREPGTVVLMRHARAPGVGDPPGFKLDDCSTQRNLNDEGRADARAAGRRLRDAGAQVGKVVASPWCRCLETARLMDVGPVSADPAFASLFPKTPGATRSPPPHTGPSPPGRGRGCCWR